MYIWKKKTNCWQFLSKKNRPCWFPTLQWRHIIPRLITWHDLPAAWCPNGHLYGTAHTALLLVLVRTNIFIVKILTMYSFLGSSFLLSICLGCGDTSVLVVPVWDLLSPGLNHWLSTWGKDPVSTESTGERNSAVGPEGVELAAPLLDLI